FQFPDPAPGFFEAAGQVIGAWMRQGKGQGKQGLILQAGREQAAVVPQTRYFRPDIGGRGPGHGGQPARAAFSARYSSMVRFLSRETLPSWLWTNPTLAT